MENPRPAPIEPRPARGRFWPLLLAALLLGLKLLLPDPEKGKPSARPPRARRPAAPTAAPAPEPPADFAPSPDDAALAVPTEEPEGCPEGCTEPRPGCSIKGNISLKTGERIYHLPWQDFYDRTKISPELGERWFCTEEEAVAGGWRRSQR